MTNMRDRFAIHVITPCKRKYTNCFFNGCVCVCVVLIFGPFMYKFVHACKFTQNSYTYWCGGGALIKKNTQTQTAAKPAAVSLVDNFFDISLRVCWWWGWRECIGARLAMFCSVIIVIIISHNLFYFLTLLLFVRLFSLAHSLLLSLSLSLSRQTF